MKPVIYIAGVHSSGKRAVAFRLAKHRGWRLIPRRPRTELLNDGLIERLDLRHAAAFGELHERIHRRFADAISETMDQRLLQRTAPTEVYLSDRGPLDAVCYRNAFLRLGWLPQADCTLCLEYCQELCSAACESAGMFLDPGYGALVHEYKRRGMHKERPAEHKSGFLYFASEEFCRRYYTLISGSSYWLRCQSSSMGSTLKIAEALGALVKG